MGLITSLIIAAIALVVGVAAASWLAPKPPDKEGIKVEREGSDHAIPVVYGTTKVGSIKVHKYVTDQAGGAKNEFLHLICAFAEGEVDAIEEIYFNGVSENDFQWNKKGGGKWYRIERFIGTDNQAASSLAVAEIPNWTSNHKLSGLCYAYIRLELDKDQTVWRGEPQITARIRGRKLFDPRNNTTVYSENPVLALRDYLLNPRYGKGLDQVRLDNASFVAAANLCDTEVTNEITRTVCEGEYDLEDQFVYSCTTETVNQTKGRFTCNIFLDTDQNVFNNVNELLSTFRGIIPLSAGSIKLKVEDAGDPDFIFDDNNVVGRIGVDSGAVNDRYNRVEIRFPNKEKLYENDSVFYPLESDPLAAQWLAEDGGVRLEQSFEFTGITKKDEALQMAEIIAKKSRFTKTVKLTSQPIGIIVEAGDIVGLTNTMHGWVEKPFRVVEKKITQDDTIDFKLTEHENAVYPWSGATFSDLSGGTFLGDPTKLPAPTNAQLQPDLTLVETGLLTWSFENNAFIRRYEIELIKDSVIVLTLEAIGQSVTVPLLDSGNYVANIYAVSSTGFRSPELAFSFTLAAPSAPTSISLTSSDWEIDAAPQLANIGLGTTFEFDVVEGDGSGYTPTAKARGASYAATGLPPSTLHTIFARSINAFGFSAWVSNSATTTITGVQTQPFLDGIELNISVLDSILGGVDAIIEDVAQDINNEYETLNNRTEIRQVRIDNLAQIEVLVDEYLQELEGETLPELNARLTVAEADINTLENTTIPAINSRLVDAETELGVVVDTTIPQLQSDLDVAEGTIAAIQGEIFSVSASVPQTIDDVLETISQDTAEIFQEIYASRIGANAVTALAIKANSIVAEKIAANAITADKIAANSVTADKITADAINGKTINGLTINGAVINAGTLNAIDITGTSSITGATINGSTINAGQLNSVNMSAGTITGATINAGTLNSNQINSAFIGSASIIGGTISAADITSGTITGSDIYGVYIEGANITGTVSIFAPTVIGGEIQGTNITATNTITGATLNGTTINTGTINSVTVNSATVNGSTIKGGELFIGGANDANSPFRVSSAGALVATSATITGNVSSSTITGGSINIGGGTFAVNSSGALTATSATINGTVTSNAGTIGGWQIQPTLLRSASSGARIQLDSSLNRVSVFDSVNEKVAMGYLAGLPKNIGSGTWTASNYGFWVRAGDNLVIDGDINYESGDWLIDNDATIKVQTATNFDIINLGTNSGNKGLFLFDGTSSRNLIGEFRNQRLFLGSSSNSIEWTPSGGLKISGDLVAATGSFSGQVRGGSIAIGGASAATAPFRVDSAGNLVATSVTITGNVSGSAISSSSFSTGLVDGSTVRGGSIETIGGTYMIVTRATPFGADNLINWYGPIAGNLSSGEPIYANLTRANAIRWIDAAGEYSRDIVSRRQATTTNTATVTHPSQNNPIVVRGRSAIDINYNDELPYLPPSTAVVTVAYRITKQGGTVAVSRTLSQNVIIQSEPLGDGTYIVDVELYIPIELEFEETIGNASRNYVFEITSITNTASLSLSPVYATSIITTEIRQ